jgi:hypothetical protein
MKKNNNEKIDFVIIWVDGNDREWRREKAQYDGTEIYFDDSDIRYRDWDNLQYWFRGIEKYTPWVNKIHFVTWGHLPKWLDTSNPKLNIVNHKDYIPKEYLPTFNSHTIELNLHRIQGLSEQFVYFNDDMFITDYMKPADFFIDGKPCDTFAMNAIFFGPDSAGTFNGADMEIINAHFEQKHVFKRDFLKWYHPKNGFKNIVRTTLLLAWPWFPGLYYNHLPNSFLKSTFETIWREEYDILHKTCSDKFRQKTNVNQWLIKFWQLAEGNYVPRTHKIGKCFHIQELYFEDMCKAVRNGNHQMICINDTAKTANFDDKKQKVIEAFESLLGCKSNFEK